jgi:putative hemolysin
VWQDVAITLTVAPLLLLFGEMFPKDLFRKRPHAMLGHCAPMLVVVRLVLAPLALPLLWITQLTSRALGLERNELSRAQGREAVFDLLRERETELQPHVEKLARNVLELRARRVERVMVPWRRVETVRSDGPAEEVWRQLAQSAFSRLPVVDARGAVRGYVHQLEVLGAGRSRPLESHLRPLLTLPAETPLDRALARLRTAGQRAALVGAPNHPIGIVTLKDLVEEISGELARW